MLVRPRAPVKALRQGWAAATLQRLDFARATDVIGGFQAWRAGGLPVSSASGPS